MKEHSTELRGEQPSKTRLACGTHCCKVHGCKYGYEDCPVVLGKEPGIRCESCDFDDEQREIWCAPLERENTRLLEDRRRLVEALRELLSDCDNFLKPTSRHPARLLLRELGEDSRP